MVEDYIVRFLNEATEKTNLHELEWNGLDEFWREEEFPDLIDQASNAIGICEFAQLLTSNSFYCRYKDGVIAILRIKATSGRDGSSWDEYAFVFQINKNSMVFCYNNDGIQEACKFLYGAILDIFNEQVRLPEDVQDFLSF